LSSPELTRRNIVNKVSRKALAGVAVLTASLLVLSGCSSQSSTPSSNTSGIHGIKDIGASYRECGVSDEGSWTDKSFNESVMDGMIKANEDLGVELKSAESNSSSDFKPNLDAMIAAKCNIIFAVGFNLVDAVNTAANDNPTLHFVTIDGWSTGATNLKPFTYNTVESAYLAGYAAADYSTTKVIATYGGMQIGAVTDFMDGYYYGAQAWAKDNGTAVKVLGWNPVSKKGDFIGGFTPNDPAGKIIAAGDLAAKADVLLPVGGDQYGALSQAISQAKSSAKMVGVDKDWSLNADYKGQILTSIMKLLGQSVYDFVLDDAISGKTFDGTPYVGTLKNGGVGVTKTDFISADLQAKLDSLKAGIIDGSINPRG
jgi:basic membrane protein A